MVSMSTIQKSIRVNVPVHTAYNHWTRFEEFPRFMEGVKEVRRLDDRHLHWKAEIAGQEREWDAEIIEQTPDQRIAWASKGGVISGGMVTFQRLSDAEAEVRLQVMYDSGGLIEYATNASGLMSLRMRGGLERFKEAIEKHGS